MTVRPASPNAAPVGSKISNSPSIRIGPLFKTVTLVGIKGMVSRYCGETRLRVGIRRLRAGERTAAGGDFQRRLAICELFTAFWPEGEWTGASFRESYFRLRRRRI